MWIVRLALRRTYTFVVAAVLIAVLGLVSITRMSTDIFPSIDVPVGDFFGAGHGYERPLNSLMVVNGSSGRSRNSYWPMPFRRHCRITITN